MGLTAPFLPPGRPRWLAVTRCLAVALLAVNPVLAAETHHSQLDWVPAEQLTPAQREQLPPGCCGAFISPLQLEPSDRSIEQLPIRAEARRSLSEANQRVIFEGEVELSQGPRLLRADRATADQQNRELTLEGNVEVREQGLLIRADSARMNLDNQDAELVNSTFVLHQSRIHGSAGNLQKFGNRLISLSDGSFTTCEPDRRYWALYASRVDLYPEDNYGSARHARLTIKDVPVLYIPYMRFPIGDQRQSGLLFPAFSTSNRNGTELSLPIYWNIAPNMDATLTPRYLSKRGLVWEGELRHLSSYFTTQLNAGYLSDDRGGSAPADGNTETNIHRGEDRWMINLTQTGGLSSRLKTAIDYTDISDAEYLLDINSSDTDVNRQAVVRKSGAMSYTSPNWRLGASVEEFRQLNQARQKPYKELPRLYADGHYRWDQWRLELANEYTRFDLTQYYNGATDRLLTGERLRTDYGISWDQRWLWGFVRPRIGVKTLSYQLQQADNTATEPALFTRSPTLAVPQASLDMGLFFERFTKLAGNEYVQTLEPRLFYFYSAEGDHDALYNPLNNTNLPVNFDTTYLTFNYNQLFRTTRFAGGDRIDDADQLAVGITSRFIAADTGIEFLRLSLGQIYRLEAPVIGLDPDNLPEEQLAKRSEYAAQISGALGPHLRLSGDALYSEQDNTITNASTTIEYSDDSNRIASLTYRYQRQLRSVTREGQTVIEDQSLDQLDLGLFLPINESWSVIGRSQYDFTYERELDTFAGFEYNDCCYRVRFLWRRWLDFDYSGSNLLGNISSTDYDRGYFIDLQLKGLASISERVGDLLGKTILGYEKREATLR